MSEHHSNNNSSNSSSYNSNENRDANATTGDNTEGATPASDKKAVALHYDGENAPRVTATGTGSTAEEIVRLAMEHEIPLMENRELVELLASIELGDEIPEALYHCIAQIIAFAYHIQEKYPPGWEQQPS